MEQDRRQLFDVAAEESVAGLCLVNKVIWNRLRVKVYMRAFFTDRCRIVWQALADNSWGESAVKDAAQRLYDAFNVLDDKRSLYYRQRWLPELITRSYEVVDMGDPMLSHIIETNTATVLHLARMREVVYQADRMQRAADKPGADMEQVIRESIKQLNRLLVSSGDKETSTEDTLRRLERMIEQ